MQSYRMWINGQPVDAESGKTFTVVNPANGEEFAMVPLGGKAEVDKAVDAARKAFPVWSGKSPAERSRIMLQIADAIKTHARELAELETLDHGFPITISRGAVFGSMQNFEFGAQSVRSLLSDVIPAQNNFQNYIQREPIGVCALITPWNFPLMMVAAKLGLALSAGNTCIVKPSTVDSLTALKLAEILQEVDLPPGVVNIITGPGGSVGNALASHPGVNMISFTGSCETGKEIMSAASGTVKRLQLELGGKNPFIVLEDADVDAAAANGAQAQVFNSGQVCASPGRFYVHEKIHDEFVKKFVDVAGSIVVGDPMDEKTQMGPMVSAEQRDKVESYIKSGIDEGARLILGGMRPNQPPLDKGYYVMPTVFEGVTQNMKIARDEIFGPVAVIMKFSSQEEVIERANDSAFALCASIWTKNMARGLKLAGEIQAGTIWMNVHLPPMTPDVPWGGFKESGIGKENGKAGLEEYTQLKVIGFNLT
ncbi:MAG: aldehyde dehydrogenase family protein [Dehalococcoidales bacterium]|nr:aldehyde dehydrogenase family protein [Dehalococcoidales bacterium]